MVALDKMYKVLSLLLTLSLFACTETSKLDSLQSECGQMQLSFQNSFYTQSIAKTTVLTESLHSLEELADTFRINPTRMGFAEIQAAFLLTYEAYQHVSLLSFMKAIEEDVQIINRFNIYPTDPASIKANIGEENYAIDSNAQVTVGLPAIDFMLFGGIGNNAGEKGVDYFMNTPSAREYLFALIANLHTRAENLNLWYKTSSVFDVFSNTGTDDGAVLSLLINAYVKNFESDFRNIKFRIPAGKFSSEIRPEMSEAYYADIGLELARENLKAFQQVFDVENNENDLKGLLLCLNEEQLATDIADQFALIANTLDEIHGVSMTEALDHHLTEINLAIDQMQGMIPLLKGSLVNALGVNITYSDSDGD